MPSVTLFNSNTFSTGVRSADGDEVTLPPRSQHQVDDKFLWNLPRGVRPVNQTVEVQPAPVAVEVTRSGNLRRGNVLAASDE